jgi:dihydrofolate reductase
MARSADEPVTVTLIAAMTRDRTIGRGGEMPWRLPGDLAHFKRTTMDSGLVLGRKTWEATGALPGRHTVVVTRRRGYRPDGARVSHDLDAAVELAARASGRREVFIGGGEEIYRQALELAQRAVLTRIDTDISGDTHFPELPEGEWRQVSAEEHPAGGRDPYPWTVEVWERTNAEG